LPFWAAELRDTHICTRDPRPWPRILACSDWLP
jgi:hypothetical protein